MEFELEYEARFIHEFVCCGSHILGNCPKIVAEHLAEMHLKEIPFLRKCFHVFLISFLILQFNLSLEQVEPIFCQFYTCFAKPFRKIKF